MVFFEYISCIIYLSRKHVIIFNILIITAIIYNRMRTVYFHYGSAFSKFDYFGFFRPQQFPHLY